VEVDLILMSGVIARAAVPSGDDTLPYGAIELRDGEFDRYSGKGVRRAVKNVNEIIGPALMNKDVENQAEIDAIMVELDGTDDLSRLGANAVFGVSMASARCEALAKGVPLYQSISRTDSATLLPVPMINALDGGSHASNNLDFKEFMIVPAGATSFSEAVRYGAEVFRALRKVILDEGYHAGVGDEGGFAPDLQNHEEAFRLLLAAIESAGYEPGKQIYLAFDAAANELCDDGRYTIRNEGLEQVDSEKVIDFYEMLADRYPIISIEDGLAADDWEGWKRLNQRLGHRMQLVGDHLFSSSPKRLSDGIEFGLANSVLIKPNQLGTVTDVCRFAAQAREGKLSQVLSHRAGETCDPFLASLAVACSIGIVKFGAMCRSERLSKYNELLRIEEELDEQARWIGLNAFPRGT
jgi:enolase 1/2/3